jgi:hypothetical protein
MKLTNFIKILLTLIVIQSCQKDEKKAVELSKWYEEYWWTNESDYNIEIESWHKSQSAISGGSRSLNIGSQLYQPLTIERDQKLPDGIFYADSMIIRFESRESITFLRNTVSEFNPLKRENYDVTKISEDRHEYTYRFTNLDFENAK